MASFNRVLLMGNLTRDPQLKYLPNQNPVTEFGIAVNRKFKTQAGEEREEVTYVDCAAFQKTAELINQYFTKGKPIFIEGRLKFDSWEDKQSGQKRSKLSVTVENFQFIGGRDGGGDDTDQRQQPARGRAPSQRPGKAPVGAGINQNDGDDAPDDSDIPFNWLGRQGQPL